MSAFVQAMIDLWFLFVQFFVGANGSESGMSVAISAFFGIS
jgi:hypothetical protein